MYAIRSYYAWMIAKKESGHLSCGPSVITSYSIHYTKLYDNLRNYKKGAATVVVPIELPGVELVQGAEKIVPLNDSLMVIPNDYGFAMLKVPALKTKKDYSRSIFVRKVSYNFV